VDMNRISELLRGLRPRQEKVLRLYFGLGCERSHSAPEMAEEFGVSAQVIAGIIGAAQRRLAEEGLTASDLREAARHASEATALRPLGEPSRCRPGPHSHHRSRAR
jgi:DNA-directed RNA polymerase sigma subunit (sigma70/sigma32)